MVYMELGVLVATYVQYRVGHKTVHVRMFQGQCDTRT